MSMIVLVADVVILWVIDLVMFGAIALVILFVREFVIGSVAGLCIT